MRDICRAAKKRLSDLESSSATQFDAHILHNVVARQINEDEALRELLHVTERAYELNESRDQREKVQTAAFRMGESLTIHVDPVREDAVGKACAEVINNAEDWMDDGPYKRHALKEAVDEAIQWLRDHDEVVDRLDLDVDIGSQETDADSVKIATKGDA